MSDFGGSAYGLSVRDHRFSITAATPQGSKPAFSLSGPCLRLSDRGAVLGALLLLLARRKTGLGRGSSHRAAEGRPSGNGPGLERAAATRPGSRLNLQGRPL